MDKRITVDDWCEIAQSGFISAKQSRHYAEFARVNEEIDTQLSEKRGEVFTNMCTEESWNVQYDAWSESVPLDSDGWDTFRKENPPLYSGVDGRIDAPVEGPSKTEGMEGILEAVAQQSFGRSRGDALTTRSCVMCGKPADKFRDELSEKEYLISRLCQACQDSIFGV